jgi:hypothetical protein
VRRHGHQHLLCKLILLVLALEITCPAQVASSDAEWRLQQHLSEAGRAAQWVAYLSQLAGRQPHRSEFTMLAWQWKAYEAQQLQWACYYRQLGDHAAAIPAVAHATSAKLPPITIRGSCAYGLRTLPSMVHLLIGAANTLQNKPYLLGGGHHSLEDVGYDCSSATSYVLIKAGLLQEVLNSTRFADYGEPGPGRYVTLWVKPGHHVFITICGLRLDTSGGRVSEGPRWRTAERSINGFMPRHPPGL